MLYTRLYQLVRFMYKSMISLDLYEWILMTSIDAKIHMIKMSLPPSIKQRCKTDFIQRKKSLCSITYYNLFVSYTKQIE
jgi:hypothetical protein